MIRKSEKEQVIIFIANMKKTGQNVLKALIYYVNKLAKREESKEAINNIIMQIKKGKDIEESLHNSGFINDFQFSVLKNSRNKNEAYDKILNYSRNNVETDVFYIKHWSKMMLGLIAMALGMPYLNKIVENMLSNIKSYKDNFKTDSLATYILQHNSYFTPIGITLTILFVVGLYYYFYTYKNDLEQHYKIFKLKALNDSVMYFEIINDMLKSGLKTYMIFELLSKYSYPKSSRDIFRKIHEKLKENGDYAGEFIKLGVNDFTVFTLKTAQEIKDIKGGFTNALVSVKDVKEKSEKKLRDTIDLISFLFLIIPFSIIGWYLTIVTIDMTSI